MERNSLWGRVLEARYGNLNVYGAERGTVGGSWWWKDLGTICAEDGDWFESNVLRKIGDGGSTRFWEDKLMRGAAKLRSRFQRLYDISNQRNSCIKNMGMWEEGRWKWILTRRGSLLIWENQMLN